MSTALAARSPAAAAKKAYVDSWSGLWQLVAAEGTAAAAERIWHPGHRLASPARVEAELRERIAGAGTKAGAA
jgi:hypothetical protein